MPALDRTGLGRGLARRCRGAWRPTPGYLALAVVCLAAGPLAAWWSAPEPREGVVLAMASAPNPAGAPEPPTIPAPVPSAGAAAPSTTTPHPPMPTPQIPRQRDPNGDQTPDLADYVNPGENPTMAEVIARLQAAGVHSGLGAFQPPGVRPPLVGLAVPEDFELPPGYVRHHQATDDGQRIEPILMFSPDHPWRDAAGQPLALPASRVVPPELAPPGLPLRRIVIPAPVEPGK